MPRADITKDVEKMKTKKVLMALVTLSYSLAPKYCETTTEIPEEMPISRETRTKITGNEAPTAARASLPI